MSLEYDLVMFQDWRDQMQGTMVRDEVVGVPGLIHFTLSESGSKWRVLTRRGTWPDLGF